MFVKQFLIKYISKIYYLNINYESFKDYINCFYRTWDFIIPHWISV